MMKFFIILLLLTGLGMIFLSRRMRSRAGLPSGKVVQIDETMLRKQVAPLFDPVLNLAGRPDYLIRRQGDTIPVEVKSGISPGHPHDSHILQLAAYCRLVEAEWGKRPPCGVILYRQGSFEVAYSRPMEDMLKATVRKIRASGKQIPDRSHSSSPRCRACGFRGPCDQALE